MWLHGGVGFSAPKRAEFAGRKLSNPDAAGGSADTKPEIAEILMNKEVIAGDQDPLGKQGKRVRHENDQDIFVKPLQDGGVAVAIVNRGKEAQTITLNWTDAGLAVNKSVTIRDLWQHKDLGTFTSSFAAPVPSRGTMMIRMGGESVETIHH
jgi:alpha-galactosidase